MIKRIIALGIIFVCSWVAWGVLTFVVQDRTNDTQNSVTDEVGQLWGTQQAQEAPAIRAVWRTTERREMVRADQNWEYVQENEPKDENVDSSSDVGIDIKNPCIGGEIESTRISREIVLKKAKKKKRASSEKDAEKKVVSKPKRATEVIVREHTCNFSLASTQVDVDLDVDHRKRGLLWFATYSVGFDSEYGVTNPFDHTVDLTVSVPLPSAAAIYDNMYLTAGGQNVNAKPESGHMTGRFRLGANSTQKFEFGYQSRGMDQWAYMFGSGVQFVENFRLNMRTNFDQIDFPLGSISPDRKEMSADGTGWNLIWDKESVVSGLNVGMIMPHKINPGPLAASMSIHAPVSLFFFFFVLFIFQVLKSIRIHPMNYFFLAASFFAFNLLLSYLVDHIDIVFAFCIASVVSILLVYSYMRRVVSTRFALLEVGLSQLMFQVLFSLAHFWEGYTGLTVTIGAIFTLAIAMHLTAKVDWESIFKSSKRELKKANAQTAVEAQL